MNITNIIWEMLCIHTYGVVHLPEYDDPRWRCGDDHVSGSDGVSCVDDGSTLQLYLLLLLRTILRKAGV